MFSLLKKALSLAGVLAVVALVLNLNIGGRASRDLAMEFWQSEGVQKVYGVLRDRVSALVRKEISVEDVFKSELPDKTSSVEITPSAKDNPVSAKIVFPGQGADEGQVIQLKNLDEQDRTALEKIVKKYKN